MVCVCVQIFHNMKPTLNKRVREDKDGKEEERKGGF